MEREAERERAAAERALREERAVQRRQRRERLLRRVPRRIRYARPGGILARRRRAQNAGVAVLFFAVQMIAWAVLSSWPARLAVLGLSVLLIPVFVTLAFDRRA